MYGKRLKNLRTQSGKTMKEFGKTFNLAESTISGYESESRKPDIDTFQKFADYFNVSVDYILGRSDIKNPETGEMYFQDKEQWTDEEIEEARAFIETRRMLKKQKNISNAKDDEQ